MVLVVCMTLQLHFLPKISLSQFCKVMFTRSYSNGKPGTKLATGVHHICWSNLGGAMWRRSVGTRESVYFLLEIRSRQLAYFVQLLQYSYNYYILEQLSQQGSDLCKSLHKVGVCSTEE